MNSPFKKTLMASLMATAGAVQAGPLAVVISPLAGAVAGTPLDAVVIQFVEIDNQLGALSGGGIPGLDSLPGLDALPLPGLDALPIPGAGGGGAGGLPGLDALPIPGLDSLAGGGLPGLDALPIPGLDALPIPGLGGGGAGGGVPGLDALPIPGLDALPIPGLGGGGGGAPGVEQLSQLTLTVDTALNDVVGANGVTDKVTDLVVALSTADVDTIDAGAFFVGDQLRATVDHLTSNLTALGGGAPIPVSYTHLTLPTNREV